MGDSDDEYDRRRARDKFRRERSDYQERRDERSRREDFPESRDRSGRRDYRDYDPRSRRDHYSPPRHDLSPPVKRMRRDCLKNRWGPRNTQFSKTSSMSRNSREDRGGYGSYGGYDMGYPPSGGGIMGGPHGPWGGGAMAQDMGMLHAGPGEPEPGMTQPPMKSFKAFLGMQDDTIDDQEAVKKYNEYKQDFRKNQISEFFINHKEEEWFKSKYHPEECSKKRAEMLEAWNRRLNIFMELYGKGWVEQVVVDVDKCETITRLLDAVVIKLEGGSDFDLKALDEPPEEEKPADTLPTLSLATLTPAVGATMPAVTLNSSTEKNENSVKQETVKSDNNVNDGVVKEEKKHKPMKQRSADSDNDDSGSSSGSSSDSDSDEDDEEEVKKKEVKQEDPVHMEPENQLKVEMETADLEAKKEVVADPEVKTEKDGEEAVKSEGAEVKAEEGPKEEGEEETKEKEEEKVPKPRPLHRTCSIFLRNLAPTITKQEVETICKRYSGFLRVAIADPQPERRFFRRGWVTFERTENIKDHCWSLNNIRLRDCELGAIVNRDLSRRIRTVNGITAHKQIVRSDIKLAARIIQNLDSQRKLWVTSEQAESDGPMFGLGSKNPLLKNITDYLIEEASAEEEELLGMSATLEEQNKEGGDEPVASTLERDEILIKVLDRILLYLRIVHSVDYYNHSEYPNEDEMPNRCGIMHARGSMPSSKVTQQDMNEWIQNFEPKVCPLLQPLTKLTDEDADKLGRKDPEAEVEKFIQSNSQELAKDKWLCPLSGKKFKGPEFIRKHIFNKHGEKVDEVRKEVEYFNNYLLDPKRPQLPEHPQNRQQQPGGPRGDMMMPYPGGFPPGGPPFPGGPGFRGPHPGFMQGKGGFGGRNNFPDMYSRPGFNKRSSYGRTPRNESRKIITYRDLDAPSENDFF